MMANNLPTAASYTYATMIASISSRSQPRILRRLCFEYRMGAFHPPEELGVLNSTPFLFLSRKLLASLLFHGSSDFSGLPQEAIALNRPTFKIPKSDEYLIELEFFHQLNCLNELTEAFYPDRFTNPWQNTKDMLSPSYFSHPSGFSIVSSNS